MPASALLLNLTDGFPKKFKPVMVTFVPGLPKNGEKLRIVGNTKKLLLVATPPAGAKTLIGPLVAFVGTVKLMFEEEFTV